MFLVVVFFSISIISIAFYSPHVYLTPCRSSRSGLRILRGASTWCSWVGLCWLTSWKTRTTSGWPVRSIRRRVCAYSRSLASQSDKLSYSLLNPLCPLHYPIYKISRASVHVCVVLPPTSCILLFVSLIRVITSRKMISWGGSALYEWY